MVKAGVWYGELNRDKGTVHCARYCSIALNAQFLVQNVGIRRKKIRSLT